MFILNWIKSIFKPKPAEGLMPENQMQQIVKDAIKSSGSDVFLEKVSREKDLTVREHLKQEWEEKLRDKKLASHKAASCLSR